MPGRHAGQPSDRGSAATGIPQPVGTTSHRLRVQPWYNVDAGCSAAAAAVGEELLVVMVPVLLLRAAGLSTGRIILIALTLRLSYHLYYGWQSPLVPMPFSYAAAISMVAGPS